MVVMNVPMEEVIYQDQKAFQRANNGQEYDEDFELVYQDMKSKYQQMQEKARKGKHVKTKSMISSNKDGIEPPSKPVFLDFSILNDTNTFNKKQKSLVTNFET